MPICLDYSMHILSEALNVFLQLVWLMHALRLLAAKSVIII